MGPDPDNKVRGVDSRLKEAEVYYSMGLFEETLNVYRNILEQHEDLSPENEEEIRSRIASVEKKLESQEKEGETPELSEEDKALLRDTIDSSDESASPLDRARTYREQGLQEGALEQYRDALGDKGVEPEEVIPELVDTLLDLSGPDAEISGKMKALVEGVGDDERKDSVVKLMANFLKERGADAEAGELESWHSQKKDKSAVPSGPAASRSRAPAAPLLKFISVDFALKGDSSQKDTFHLDVINQSEDEIDLLVTEEDADLMKMIKAGDTIKDVLFYAHSAVRKMSVVVKGFLPIEEGINKERHIMAVVQLD